MALFPMTTSVDVARWRDFRAQVIELDGGVCRRCGRGPKDDVVLQVHHLEYITGRKPWEYQYAQCETLCKGCHAAEHGKIPPRSGWVFLGSDDLGDLTGTCEYCGNEIRYVYYVHHAKWDQLGVGTVCCDNLTGTEQASDHRELLKRKDRFVASPRWSINQGVHSIRQKLMAIEIRPVAGAFRICINGRVGKKTFASADEAKRFVFDVIESGKAEAYLQKKRNRG